MHKYTRKAHSKVLVVEDEGIIFEVNKGEIFEYFYFQKE